MRESGFYDGMKLLRNASEADQVEETQYVAKKFGAMNVRAASEADQVEETKDEEMKQGDIGGAAQSQN